MQLTERKVAALMLGLLVDVVQDTLAEPMAARKQKRMPLIERQISPSETPADSQSTNAVDVGCQRCQRVRARQAAMRGEERERISKSHVLNIPNDSSSPIDIGKRIVGAFWST